MQRRTRLPPEPAPRLVAEGELRVGPVAKLPEVLRRHRVDPAGVAARAGIDLAFLRNPDHPISARAVGRLLDEAARRAGCEHIGLEVGALSASDALGLIGRLVCHSPDVGTAMRNAILHFHLHDRGAVPTLSAGEGVAVLGYAIYARDVEGAGYFYDAAIAIACNILRELCGPGWRPRQVLLARRRPRSVAPYRAFFRAPVRFDADESAIVFDEAWLARPLRGADGARRAALEVHIAEIERRVTRGLPDRLRFALRSLLVKGKGSREEVAKLFSMHGRTLNRRLAAQETSFHALVEEVRYEIARQLMRDTQMPLADVAAALDYADASAFTRAFRRWAGITPSAWRAGNSRPAR